jgi:hypothetical protein
VALAGRAPFLAARARGVGSKAFAILAFRRSYELVSHSPLGGVAPRFVGKQTKIAGEDAIDAAARGI